MKDCFFVWALMAYLGTSVYYVLLSCKCYKYVLFLLVCLCWTYLRVSGIFFYCVHLHHNSNMFVSFVSPQQKVFLTSLVFLTASFSTMAIQCDHELHQEGPMIQDLEQGSQPWRKHVAAIPLCKSHYIIH